MLDGVQDSDLQRLIQRAMEASENPEMAARRAEAEAREQRSKQQSLLAALEAVGVPKKTREAALGELETNSALGQVRSWAQSGQTMLVIGGDHGIGKSVAAAWWMAQTVRDVTPTPKTQRRWWWPMALVRKGAYSESIEQLHQVSSLVIDDASAEFSDEKGFFASIFTELINARYEAQLPTLLTANGNPAVFRSRYGERFFDRLCEVGSWVSVIGKSYRKRAAAPDVGVPETASERPQRGLGEPGTAAMAKRQGARWAGCENAATGYHGPR